MPELPEVETIRSQLNNLLKSLTIKGIDVRSEKSFVGPKEVILNTKITKIERRGKIILFYLSNGLVLAVHLKMTGQLIYYSKKQIVNSKKKKKKAPRGWPNGLSRGEGIEEDLFFKKLPNKHTRVIVTFTNGDRLFFNDMRRFGWMKIIVNSKKQIANRKTERSYSPGVGECPPRGCDEARNFPEVRKLRQVETLNSIVGNLGPDPLKDLTLQNFKKIVNSSKRAVKLVLMDQQRLAGVGNIYANEALFCAGIDPRKQANKISTIKAKRLLNCLKKILISAIKWKGASSQHFLDAFGKKGEVQEHLLVYDREGENCLNKCGGKVKRIRLGGRGTFFCPKCQQV